MNRKKSPDGRARAAELLDGVFLQGRWLSDSSSSTLPPRDEAFAHHLAYAVLRYWSSLDWLANQLLSKALRQRDRDIHYLITLGLYQLWKEDTASHAAVHASAESARSLGKSWAVGLINAVLRRFQREKDQWLALLAKNEARFNHPEWLLRDFRKDWPDEWPAIIDANQQQAALWLRCNARKVELAQLRENFHKAGFKTEVEASAPQALRVEPAVGVSELPGFSEGLCSVQDPAAQLATGLMELESGMRVLDACAAPGGKTCHMLESQPDIQMLALDQHEHRLGKVRENLERLGLRAQLEYADASEVSQWWDGQPFDRILLDAPCSASGVIRRHPEIKWLRTPDQVQGAVETQKLLLERLWPLLKPGGMLVYATCSVLKLENSQQIHNFIESHADSTSPDPDTVPGIRQPYGRQILPGDKGMDGFFYAVLRKSAGNGACAEQLPGQSDRPGV